MTKDVLQKRLIDADKAYYEDSNPIMTDKEYDRLREQVPLTTVPDTTSTQFSKYTHPIPLLSLDKIHDDDPNALKKLTRFYEKCSSIILQPKLDGLTLAAVPINGQYKFVTRGRGGIEGEILPHTIGGHSNIVPKNDLQYYTLRGEAYITEKNFNLILQEQREKGEQPFRNSRNAASGILRNIDTSPYLKYIDYMIYEIVGSSNSPSKQLADLWEYSYYTEIPYVTSSHPRYAWETPEELMAAIQKFYQDWIENTTPFDLETKDIPIDGIVLKYNVTNPSQFGTTNHHPLNAIAWKKTADEYETEIKDITWQVGRSSVTPVAELEPVEIDGTIVSRATLHNLGFFNDLAPAPNDIAVICKSGEIIPKVLRISMRSDKPRFKAPKTCPVCGKPLTVQSRKEKGRTIENLCCTNPSCSERIAQNIAFLASKDVLDIQGLSLQTARKIVEKYPDKDETIIFDLTLEDILSLPGFKTVSATKLLQAIAQAKKKPVSIGTLFKSCCIEGIGDTVGTALEQKFSKYDSIVLALLFPKGLEGISGIGPKTIKTITEKDFIRRLTYMKELLNVQDKEPVPATTTVGAAQGTHWVITGKFIINDAHITRDELVEKIESIGGVVDKTVSKGTDYLLIADPDSTSTKAQKARKLGIQLVSYDFLRGMLMV